MFIPLLVGDLPDMLSSHISALTRLGWYRKGKFCPVSAHRRPRVYCPPNTAPELHDEYFTGQQSCCLPSYYSQCSVLVWNKQFLLILLHVLCRFSYYPRWSFAATGVTRAQNRWSSSLSLLLPLWDHGDGVLSCQNADHNNLYSQSQMALLNS